MYGSGGKQIASTLAELVDPKRAALLIWDMEYAIGPNAFNYKDILANLKILSGAARQAGVPVFQERNDGGIRNVVRIEEGLSYGSDLQRHLARQDVGQEGPFGEVLGEPAAAQHSHLRPRCLDDPLRSKCLLFTAARKQH